MLLAVTNDLMAAAPIEAAARQNHLPCRVVGRDELAGFASTVPVRLILLDLNACDQVATVVSDIRAVVPADVPIVAFGPHVHTDKLQAAKTAGCQQVLTRGQFHQQAGRVIAEVLAHQA